MLERGAPDARLPWMSRRRRAGIRFYWIGKWLSLVSSMLISQYVKDEWRMLARKVVGDR